MTKSSRKKLQYLIENIWSKFPYYRQLFEIRGLKPSDDPVAILDHLPTLDNPGYLEFQKDIFNRLKTKPFLIEYTSGTTGQRKIRFVTQRDEDAEEKLCVRFFRQCELNPSDRVLALDIDSSEIYLFYAKALSRLGVEIFSYLNFPSSEHSLIRPFFAFKPSVILSIPTVLWKCKSELKLLKQKGALKKVLYIAESMNDYQREVFSKEIGLELFSFYGSFEIGSVAGECKEHKGIHIFNDAVIPTLLDPVDKGDYLVGEAAWTTLHFRDQSLIKYRTGDIISIKKYLCSCGSEYPLMSHYVTRTRDTFSIYGQKFKYEDFELAIVKKVGPIEFLRITITPDHKCDRIIFQVPESLIKERHSILLAIKSTGDFDYFLKMGFIRCDVEFYPIQKMMKRKLERLTDYRY